MHVAGSHGIWCDVEAVVLVTYSVSARDPELPGHCIIHGQQLLKLLLLDITLALT